MFELRGVVGRLAGAIADGEPIAWNEIPLLGSSAHERALVDRLRDISLLARESEHIRFARIADDGAPSLLWTTVSLVVAAEVLIALGLLPRLFALQLEPPIRSLLWFRVAVVASFAVAALFLTQGRSSDARARRLGYIYVLVAAAFAQSILSFAALHTDSTATVLFRGVFPEVFLPLAVWRFSVEFPRAKRFTTFDRVGDRIAIIMLAIGVFFCLNSWVFGWVGQPSSEPWRVLWLLRRSSAEVSVPFWLVTFTLMLLGLGASIWRMCLSTGSERQRVVLFLLALGLGLLPLFTVAVFRAESLLFRGLMASNGPTRRFVDGAVWVGLLSVPFSTAYAVIIRQVLDVRVVVRHALRYALARLTLVVIILAAVALPLWQIYQHRNQRIDDLLANWQSRLAIWILIAGAVLFVARERLLAVVDRVFMGQPVDHARTLAGTTGAISRGRTAREVAFEAARNLERTFAVSDVAILMRGSADGWQPLCGSAPPMPAETSLLALLSEVPAVALNHGGNLFNVLPPADQEWLLRTQFDVIARVPVAQQEIGGIVGIGCRATGASFSSDDLSLIAAIMTTAGLAIHRPWTDEQEAAARRTGDDVGAVECERCGIVGVAVTCGCGAPHRPALLPPKLEDRFAVVRRLGQGGMGVVYAGQDLRLGRPVALKTLPRVSSDAVTAMLAEAKAMALVDHSHLASIYSLEMWRDTPILVVEYLAGGTLADRLRGGPLSLKDGLAVGVDLSDALAALHDAGILHRDIKPSNVAFTKTGVLKVLDFGVARLLAHADINGAARSMPATARELSSTALAGTPLYLSPESLNGAAPDVAVDIWSAAVVTLEAIAGIYPFAGRTASDAIARVRDRAPDWRHCRERLTPAVAAVFDAALHPDVRRRPPTARVIASQLRAVAAQFT